MVAQVSGFTFWEIGFDEQAQFLDTKAIDSMVAELPGQALTDLIILSHGWNNDRRYARGLYERLLGQVREVLHANGLRDGAKLGAAGVYWPSMRWADESGPDNAGGAASFGAPASDRQTVEELKAVYPTAKQQRAIDDLARLLDERPDDPKELARFQKLMGALVTADDATDDPDDNGELALLEDDPQLVYERFATVAPEAYDPDAGTVAGLGDLRRKLWEGAKNALRQATYWEMKKRAGVVGQTGLGPLIGRLHEAQPDMRVHLVGHSFGARLVSFALAGLPAGDPSPVKSLVLLQGAFSHFAFARSLPHAPSRGGGLAGMAARVDGPIVVCYSIHDSAVGTLYPLASISAGQDAAAMEDRFYRWGAMGYDGAQAVGAAQEPLRRVGQGYKFAPGKVFNLDGKDIVATGGPPAGAHSDIFHPEIAWAMLNAAGL
ncbi:MAG: serine-threonine protein kinase [Chloroflexota bacterium]|nr:serine-threonine protein kinase [Chloroflexota bacterium]